MSDVIRFPRSYRQHSPEPAPPVRVIRAENEWFVIYDGVAELHTNLSAALTGALELSDALGSVRITIDH